MGTSKQLITALEKSDWIDRMLIISGLAFFFLIVAFILKQRIFDRGLRMALWWTKFLPNFGDETSSWDLEDVAEKGSMSLQSGIETLTGTVGTVTAAVSSVAASVSSVAAAQGGTGSPLPEQITQTLDGGESLETSVSSGDLTSSLSQVLEATFSGVDSTISSSPTGSPRDEL